MLIVFNSCSVACYQKHKEINNSSEDIEATVKCHTRKNEELKKKIDGIDEPIQNITCYKPLCQTVVEKISKKPNILKYLIRIKKQMKYYKKWSLNLNL